jgi:hypothetical protein
METSIKNFQLIIFYSFILTSTETINEILLQRMNILYKNTPLGQKCTAYPYLSNSASEICLIVFQNYQIISIIDFILVNRKQISISFIVEKSIWLNIYITVDVGEKGRRERWATVGKNIFRKYFAVFSTFLWTRYCLKMAIIFWIHTNIDNKGKCGRDESLFFQKFPKFT